MITVRPLSFKSAKDKSPNAKKNFAWRYITIVSVVLTIFVSGLVFQMYRWQVAGYEKYSQMAKSLHVQDERLPTSRGTITTADGSVLAVDMPVWGIYASVSQSEEDREAFDAQRDTFIDKVSTILNIDKDELDQKLTADFAYVPLKHYATPEEKAALERENLFGLYYEEEEKRIYPNGKLASQIVGFMGKDADGNDIGMYGLEGYYAGDLLGQEGFKYEEKDSLGNVIMTGEYDPVLPRQGKDLTLTIRSGIQSKVEAILEQGVKDHEAKSGSVIVMDPRTGEIIAMANYPTYDPNYYWAETDYSVYRNKAISDVYEYGSVNKTVTVASAVEEGKITPESVCSDPTGSIEVLDKTIYTWDRNPDFDQLPQDVLKNSNNVCAVQYGQAIGIDKYYEYLQKFGIGNFIGIGLQDEATSYLKPLDEWNEVDLACASFGQMISATPLQIISAVSAIANNGTRMRPYLVKELSDENETIEINPQVASQPISADTAVKVQDMMEVAVVDGEERGWFSKYLPEYNVAGKTGTAQIPKKDSYGYYEDLTNATFIGFSPVHNAKMIMIVRIEEPKDNPYAASTAVPVWVDIYKAIAMDLGIAPGE